MKALPQDYSKSAGELKGISHGKKRVNMALFIGI
jgi:hypothetical protein